MNDEQVDSVRKKGNRVCGDRTYHRAAAAAAADGQRGFVRHMSLKPENRAHTYVLVQITS